MKYILISDESCYKWEIKFAEGEAHSINLTLCKTFLEDMSKFICPVFTIVPE